MTVTAILISMLMVGGSIYIITKVIENMFCSDNGFLGFLNTFGVFIVEAAIILGLVYFILVFAGHIENILIAL